MIQHPSHPIWKIIRYAVVATTLIVLCSTMYQNGFDKKDIVLIASTLASLAGYDHLKGRFTEKENAEGS